MWDLVFDDTVLQFRTYPYFENKSSTQCRNGHKWLVLELMSLVSKKDIVKKVLKSLNATKQVYCVKIMIFISTFGHFDVLTVIIYLPYTCSKINIHIFFTGAQFPYPTPLSGYWKANFNFLVKVKKYSQRIYIVHMT